MSFIDHLEALRWHLIRSVIAILVGSIVFFIFVKDIVNDILLAPARDTFVTYGWFCKMSHALGLGDAVCMGGVKVSFLSTEMTSHSFRRSPFLLWVVLLLPSLIYSGNFGAL
ncbi:MAG: twin-arginine translocase subunit TatC [Chitinophagaceae bacterium]